MLSSAADGRALASGTDGGPTDIEAGYGRVVSDAFRAGKRFVTGPAGCNLPAHCPETVNQLSWREVGAVLSSDLATPDGGCEKQ